MNLRFSLGGARGSSGIPGRIPVSDSSASFITEMLSPIPVSDTYYFCQSLRCLCVDSLDASGTRLDGFISVVQAIGQDRARVLSFASETRVGSQLAESPLQTITFASVRREDSFLTCLALQRAVNLFRLAMLLFERSDHRDSGALFSPSTKK